LAEVLDFILDEWTTAYQFDLVREIQEIGLGTYFISKRDARIPNLIKKKDNFDGLWNIFLWLKK
jgi:hypothetical protein